MKLLLDENLPSGLVQTLDERFPGSSHVLSLGLGQTADSGVFQFAGQNGFTILTKDDDFVALSQRFGTPPKVLVKIGNAGVATIRAFMLRHSDQIAEFIQSTDEQGLLIIG